MSIKPWKVFFMFMMFMWVASVTPLTGFNFGNNPILMPVYLVILFFYYVKYCKHSFKPLLIILLLFLFWYIISCFKYGNLQGFQFQPIYSILIAHIAFNIYNKEEFIYLFGKFLLFFCILSLVVWFAVNLVPSIALPFMHSIAVIENQPPTETNSVIVGVGSHITMGLRRNIGFTWEPGKFSCWIILGIYFNLISKKFKLKGNTSLYIYVVTLLTTMSTTGYSMLAILILFFILNKRSKASKFYILLISILLLPIVLGLSFMGDKISGLMNIDGEVDAIIYSSSHGADVVTPQRFSGILFDCMNFINDFWFGYNQNENSYTTKILFDGISVAVSNGVINILSKYGVFIGAFFYYWLFKSSKSLSDSLNYKGKYMFALVFLTMSISYDFWENCILMFFYFRSYYSKFSPSYCR